MSGIKTEQELLSVALALLGSMTSLSTNERRLAHASRRTADRSIVKDMEAEINAGRDPLGDAFIAIRAPEKRRQNGAVFTPAAIIDSMIGWAASNSTPSRIVDPGAGSGRFLLAAAERFPNASLIGVEMDPLVSILLRANLAVRGLRPNARIIVGDYRSFNLERIDGETLFIGNPPYVRHHDISESWKNWFAESAAALGIRASKLAGLHLHFFFKTMQLGKRNDVGCFITAAEWLDTNYGSALRELLRLKLGGLALHVLEPTAMPFINTATTGAITCFRIGQKPDSLRVRSVKTLKKLNGLSRGKNVLWSQVIETPRWSTLIRSVTAPPAEFVELGELCRVHRGQVTGANDVWIAGPSANGLPSKFLVPAVTKARDLIEAGAVLNDPARLRRVIDLPTDLDEVPQHQRRAVKAFIDWARRQGANEGYIATHRRAWWSVGLKEPAPIICTYMARRPPVFVRNECDARHINIAHGLYPREPLSDGVLNALAAWLNTNVRLESGRVYAGGLTKFEPGEVERIPVPRPENLQL